MAVRHETESNSGYAWRHLGKRSPELFKGGTYSRNRNPMATREVGGRQTYQGRDYRGQAGEFTEEQQILIRYSEDDLFDMAFIDDLKQELEDIANSQMEADDEALEFGREVAMEALVKYTPIDTGELVSHWTVDIDYETRELVFFNSSEYASNQEYGMYGDQDDGYTENSEGKKKSRSLWYPGYYMMHKAMHESAIAMREFARMKQEMLKGMVENGK